MPVDSIQTDVSLEVFPVNTSMLQEPVLLTWPSLPYWVSHRMEAALSRVAHALVVRD